VEAKGGQGWPRLKDLLVCIIEATEQASDGQRRLHKLKYESIQKDTFRSTWRPREGSFQFHSFKAKVQAQVKTVAHSSVEKVHPLAIYSARDHRFHLRHAFPPSSQLIFALKRDLGRTL